MEAPIFIVGASRSGTSLIRNILNRHPRIAICGETHFHHYVYKRRRSFGDLSDLKNRRRLIEEYLALKRLRFITDPHGLTEKLLREGASYQALFTSFVKYHSVTGSKQRWGEKTPQHAFFAETLCEWYPAGTIIHMIRDPRDVVASLQRMPWAPDTVVPNARRWLSYNLAAHRCSSAPQYLPVRYEALVAHPEQEVARICERLGEEYFPGLLDPQGHEVFPPPVPWTQGALQTITTERLGSWRQQLSPKQVAQIEWIIGPDMDTFGYERVSDHPSSLTIALGLAQAALDTMRTRLTQLPGIWYHLARPTKLSKEEFWMSRRVLKSGIQL
jgi:hypothetical protein